MILLDEIDKAARSDRGDPTAFLHELLERQSAAAFRDSFLDVPMRADRIIWLATNSLDSLRSSVTDRMLVLEVGRPTANAWRAVVSSIVRNSQERYGPRFDVSLDDAVLQALDDATPRLVTRLIELGVGYALSDRRRRLKVDDINGARRLVNGSVRPRIGF